MRRALDLITDFVFHIFKEHPRLATFTTMMCVATLFLGSMVFADQGDIESLRQEWTAQARSLNEEVGSIKTQIENLDVKLDQMGRQDRIDTLEAEIRDINMQVLDLERLENSGEANQRDLELLDRLRQDLRESNRELNLLTVGQ